VINQKSGMIATQLWACLDVRRKGGADFGMAATSARGQHRAARNHLLARWWRHRRAVRRAIEYAAWELRERYGGAAYVIASNSARQPVGHERRKFWLKVAKQLRGVRAERQLMSVGS
jgi:hypothetical protein